jgi:hypothetical protein
MNTRLKLSTAAAMLATFALAGCATTPDANNTAVNTVGTATNIGMNVFKVAVDTTCRTEIEKQNAWRLAKVALTAEQQEAAKTKVCGCVSEQAPQQVGIVEMTNAAIDSKYRNQLVAQVVTKSLQSCYSSMIK